MEWKEQKASVSKLKKKTNQPAVSVKKVYKVVQKLWKQNMI